MSGPFRWLAAATALVLVGTPSFAQDAAVLPFPAKAPVVLHLHGIDRTKARLVKMLAALPPAEARFVAQALDAGHRQLFAGRKLTAIPSNGRFFVVVHDFNRFDDDALPVSLLVPVTNYQAFRETFLTPDERKTLEAGPNRIDQLKLNFPPGEEIAAFAVDLKDYVAFTPDRAVAEKYAGKYARADVKQFGPELAASFLDADLSVYVNMAVINETHREDIRDYKELIEFSLKQAQMNEMLPPGFDKRQLEQASELVGVAFQGIRDCRALVVAAEFRPAGLNLRVQARFADDTPTAKLLLPEKLTPLADLGKLPPGLASYSAVNLGPKTAVVGRVFDAGFQAAPDDEAATKTLLTCEEARLAAGPGAEFAAGSAGAHLTATAYAEPRQAVAAEIDRYAALTPLARIGGLPLKEKPQVKPEAQSHRGFAFAEVRIVLDFEASVLNLPEQSRGPTLAHLKRMNREKATHWIGTDGKLVIHVSAEDWPAARRLLDAFLDGKTGIGSTPGFQLMRKNLPPEATAIWCFETAQLLGTILDYARDIFQALPGGGMPDLNALKPPTGPPTYIGLALTLKSNTVTVDLFVPGEAMNAAARMFAPVLKPID